MNDNKYHRSNRKNLRDYTFAQANGGKKIAIVDMDSTLVDLMSPWLKAINLIETIEGHKPTKLEDIKQYQIDQISPLGDRVYKLLKKDGIKNELLETLKNSLENPVAGVSIDFNEVTKLVPTLEGSLFSVLKPLNGASQFMDRLCKNYKVYITTAHSDAASAEAKVESIARLFPQVNKRNVILAKDKSLIKAHVMIDDDPNQLLNHEKNFPDCAHLGIIWPWNEDFFAQNPKFEGFLSASVGKPRTETFTTSNGNSVTLPFTIIPFDEQYVENMEVAFMAMSKRLLPEETSVQEVPVFTHPDPEDFEKAKQKIAEKPLLSHVSELELARLENFLKNPVRFQESEDRMRLPHDRLDSPDSEGFRKQELEKSKEG